jgi:hypothetical protein
VQALHAATLLVAVVVAAAAASGCGARGSVAETVDVEFVREDGSAASFPENVRAWCGPFDEDNPDVEAVHVFAGEPPQGEPAEPFWTVSAVRADVEREPTTTLPSDFVYTEPRGAVLFVLDDAEHGNNELSSTTEESAGTILVELSGCQPGDTVRLAFDDVTLGSELHDLPTMSVAGTAVVEIGSPP